MQFIGESAAVATSCLWTANSIMFSAAGRKIGFFSVNAYRILMAVGFLAVTHIVLIGSFLPLASGEQWLWISLSGIVGLGIGDFGLFAAFVLIGPRRSVLVMALSPIFASLSAIPLLGEVISPIATVGVAVTILGVTIVILEKNPEEKDVAEQNKMRGSLLALVGAVCQGLGLVLAKKGIHLHAYSTVNPLSATLIRMMTGAAFVWMCALLWRKTLELRRALGNKKEIEYTAAGAFVGPFLGVTLSMVAVTYTEAGIAQTLMSLMPVFIIPVMWTLYRQKTSWRGIVGAVIAVFGVATLFLT